MANIAQAAGNNGVSGSAAPSGYTALTALGATYNDNGNLEVGGSNAVRRSVCQSGGSVSTVWSETAGFRTAYVGVEVDLPALDATRTGA